MLEQIVLGIIQGIAEWLPVSSEGLLFLIKKNFFNSGQSLEVLVQEALFLHLGTFLAALIYFRREVKDLLINKKARNTLNFLVLATLVSGIIGWASLKIFSRLESGLVFSVQILNLIIAIFLIITGLVQLMIRQNGYRSADTATKKEGFLLGLAQGLAVLPGLSRSGLTVSILLLRKFESEQALRLSFLMSLPIVLAGNIILNLKSLSFSIESFLGLLFAFIFGWLTIGLLLKIAKEINFGYFVLIIAVLIIISLLIS